MKKRTLFISTIISVALITSAQVPQKFNYQAVVRNSQNVELANQSVGFKMSLLKGSVNGEMIYSESHTIVTNQTGLADLIIGEGSIISDSFEDIQWGDDLYFLKVEVDPSGGTSYEHLGTSQLISVPYALYSANVSSPTRKFTIQEETGHPVDSALFEVRNAEGQTVFAVYPEGTRVYVLDAESKGVKRGFAVGGYSRNSKGITQEYMHVSPDSIRMYFNEEITKGVKRGFAVGGYSRDSKGSAKYFDISGQNSAEIIPGKNRVVWYPQRNAFLVGNVLVESADSVGENSIATGYQSKAIGNYSEAFGHRSIARGDYSTAIGDNATANAINSVSIGDHSRAEETSSFALGTGAIASGANSYAIGSSGIDDDENVTGNTKSIGEQSFALGMGAQAEGFGSFSIGTKNNSTGNYSIAMGYKTMTGGFFSTAMGIHTQATGHTSTAMGRSSVASGGVATATGGWTVASGLYSTTTGLSTRASGDVSTAMGRNTIARSSNSLVIGTYNDTLTTSSLFIIGNGSSDFTRHNAMMVMNNGEIFFPDVYTDIVAAGRDLVIAGDGKIGYVSSSRRYKSNITSIEDIGWLYNLRPVNFMYKDDNSKTKQYGLIAEEVEDVNPLFVSYNEKGDPETVSYNQLVSPMLKALQEQNKIIQALQEEVEKLKAQVGNL